MMARAEAASTAAERLRELSGLGASRLAAIFGVSRVTYQNWVAGTTPQDGRREHLLEALALVEEAAHRLSDPRATGDWLLTPVSPMGRKPIDLLAAREYETSRGFVLRLPVGQQRARLLPPSRRAHRRLSREAVDDALARLRPRASIADAELAQVADGDTVDADPDR
ncbi:MAG: hypothetical protein HY690_09935 [Chloroflexi bacterium]|nr:hypothetical protein [Chloroflexota bacterium]